MSEVIVSGDPLWDRIMKTWWKEGRPATVTVGNVVYRDIGQDKFVASHMAGGDMAGAYGSQSVGYNDNSKIDAPDGAPTNFRPTY